ncbi:MAG: hypothetical protein QOK49_1908 [Baekduia sp.]|jgi:hypothetical protein|nr:hypothetical protein [Baekduia sp.]
MAATAELDIAPAVLELLQEIRVSSTGARPGPASWSRRELLRWWRDRNHRDPVGGVRLDRDDDVERAAIAGHVMAWNTPEAVASMLATESSRAALSDLWAALRPSARQLYRRRAAIVLAAADRTAP